MSENLEADYLKFKKEIAKSTRLIFTIEKDVEVVFKKHHTSTYAIALILAKIKKDVKDENKLIFFAEILSDILTVSKLAFIGLETPSLIVLRRIIENFYNHIYYFDHPVEYEHLNAGKNEYTPIDKLKLYFDTHPVFYENEDKTLKDYNQLLFKEYHQLCKVVHSKGKDSMNLAKCLKDLNQEFDIKGFLSQLINIELYIIYLTYKFHNKLSFTPTEKTVITSIVPTGKRSHLNE